MSNAYRLDQIYSVLIHKTSATVEELAELFQVTPTTIRRDLLVMEERGLINRSRGSASLSSNVDRTPNFFVEEKSRIAKAAAKFLTNDMSIALDSGSTISAFIDYIIATQAYSGLNVVTHSPQTAIKAASSFAVSMPGGCLLPNYDFVVGVDVEDFYRKVKVDIAFMGSTSVCNCSGLTVSYPLQLNVKKYAVECADRSIAMLDSSKFIRRGIYVFCDFRDLDTLITVETEENRPQLDRIAKEGVDIIVV